MDDDEQAAALVAWLQEQGYETVAHDVDGGHPGNRLTRLVRGTCQVTLSRDRGQWFVEVGPSDGEGFEIGVWEACLREQTPSLEPPGFAEESRLLQNLLHEVERTLVLDAAAPQRLAALRDWVQETRWSSAG